MRKRVVDVDEARTRLSKLVRRAAAGEEVIITSAGKPVAKIVGYSPSLVPRRPGLLQGQIRVKHSFDGPPRGFEDAFGS
jgi:prevent-host-death family protein